MANSFNHERDERVAGDGTKLAYQHWAHNDPRGAVVIAHGLGEHSGRYDQLAQFLVARGFDVWAQDHRGHGNSAGARGVIAQADDLLLDLHGFIEIVSTQTGAAPYLLGHSLGGLVAAAYATHRTGPLRGLILSSPALKLYGGGAQRLLAQTLSRLAPAMTVPNGLKVDGISHDAAVVAAYKSDPLVHGRISSKLAYWMMTEADYVRQNVHRVQTPTLVMWAGQDKLVDPAGSALFVKRMDQTLVTSHAYPALFHEIFNETEDARATVLRDLADWLNRH